MPTLPEKPFAEGRTAKLYDWKPGWALKLYVDEPWLTERIPTLEAQNTRTVHEAGIPSPAVGEVFRHDGHWALELQKLSGDTMGNIIAQKPWTLWNAARQLSALHRQLHNADLNVDIPSQVERWRHKIGEAPGLNEQQRHRLLKILDALPLGHSVCHSDFHPWNIMITDNGPVIIDWLDSTMGHGLGDVARTVMLLRGLSSIDDVQTSWAQRVVAETLANVYLRDYLKHNPDTHNAFSGWMAVNAGACLSERIPGMQPYLLNLVDSNLAIWDRR